MYSNWVQKRVKRRLRHTFANSRRSVKVPGVDMLLTNKYGCNFKIGVSLSNKDLIVEMTEKTEYEQSLFRLVRRAWGKSCERTASKNGRVNSLEREARSMDQVKEGPHGEVYREGGYASNT